LAVPKTVTPSAAAAPIAPHRFPANSAIARVQRLANFDDILDSPEDVI
jgi:hypothetical protein